MSSDNDLILLMEGYKNTIDLNVALSKQIQEIVTKLVVLDNNITNITKAQEVLISKEPNMISCLEKLKIKSSQYKDSILASLVSESKESYKRASKIKLMIWVGYVGSISILATLVTILFKIMG